MKQDAFRTWLVAQGQSEVSASSRVSTAKRAEQYLGDLDEVFAQQDRDSVLSRFAYTTEDERAGRPNPSPVPIDGVLRTGLASLQQSLKLYHAFLTEQSKVPDKTEHQALPDRLTRHEDNGGDGAFSRDRIEGAMDAHDQFRETGAHAEVFSGFEEPSRYWVRSSKPRRDQRFPTKPIVGFILGKSAKALNGGWSQSSDAAARLHAAGYIITDQNDTPLPLPEQYTHLMRGAERARLVAVNYFIEPAREAGLSSVTIRAGDLHDMCGLVKNWANVCQALEGEIFQTLAAVPAPTRTGPERSTTTEYTFVLRQDGAAKDVSVRPDVQIETTNLILYGPPGTGKTYRTAWEAVRDWIFLPSRNC